MTPLFAVLLLVPGVAHAAGYDVARSTNYVGTWWYTTDPPGNMFKTVSHVNSGLAQRVGPYTWYWLYNRKTGETRTNDGDDTILATDGEDCTNFVSQALKEGGITFTTGTVIPYWGKGNTLVRVRELQGALRSIATPVTFFSPAGAPANLAAGDVVIWSNRHSTIVLSGTGRNVILGAHSNDMKSATLDYYFDTPVGKWARAFHLAGVSVTTATTASDATAPSTIRRDSQGRSIPDGGFGTGTQFTAEVSDSGSGIDSFEVAEREPILDQNWGLILGRASYVISDPTFYGSGHTYSIDLSRIVDGTTVYFQALDAAGNLELTSFQLDRVTPTAELFDANGAPLVYASSMTQVTVKGSDASSGIDKITLLKPDQTTSTQTFSGQLVAYATFTSLADGSYTAIVFDRAQNSVQATFKIQTIGPACVGIQDVSRNDLYAVMTSTEVPIFVSTGNLAGVCSIKVRNPSGQDIGDSQFNASLDAVTGPFTNLSTGVYTVSVADCAGNVCQSTFSVVLGTGMAKLCLTAVSGSVETSCSSTEIIGYSSSTTRDLRLRSLDTCYYDGVEPSPGTACKRMAMQMSYGCNATGWQPPDIAASTTAFYYYPSPGACTGSNKFVSTDMYVYSSTDGAANFGITATLMISTSAGTPGYILMSTATLIAPATAYTIIYASITAPGTIYSELVSSPDSGVSLASYFTGIGISSQVLSSSESTALFRVLLAQIGKAYTAHGSDFVFTSTTMISMTETISSGVSVDTTTIGIYKFDGTNWSTSAVSSQFVSVSSLGVVTASGAVTNSGTYSLLYRATDSSAPITTMSIQGSTYAFDGAIFASTDSFVVLVATDPVVNGFASTVASITYRVDPASGSPFYIYDSSVPLPLGTHVVEYRSIDYAGNVEVVNTATFTVTAGASFRNSSTTWVPGNFLNGFLGSGAKAEIESRAEDSLTLMVSSANRQALVSVDNIGEVGIGVTPQSNLNIGQSAIGLQLRSGNSTSSVTSAQIAFGYNGDYAMRHFLRTEHSTATEGNKMDFLVWNPGAGSTTTLANLNALSLQGIAAAGNGSFHVHPVGEPDVEVEVSDGLTTGGGTMQRLQVLTPSSRRFKTDIEMLDGNDETKALLDVVNLKHVRFRYKSRQKDDPAQELRTGLIYEDAPESIRAEDGTLSSTERLANAEMALKAAIKRLEELERRYARLKARGKP